MPVSAIVPLIRFRLMPPADYRTFFRLIAACACSFALVCCSGEEDERAAPAPSRDSAGIRIVSLSPAMSRMVADLGLRDNVIGRSPYCLSIDPSVPVVGDHFNVDLETLVRLEPTHILVQPPRDEVPRALAELADEHDWTIIHAQIDTIADIRNFLRELPPQLAGESNDAWRGQLQLAADHLVERLDLALQLDRSPIWSGRVLLVYSTESSISVFGSSTYLDEILRAIGCENAAAHIDGWGELSLEDVARLDPDGILLIDASGRLIDDLMGPLATLEINAVERGLIGVVTHPQALLPSTSCIDVSREMRELLAQFVEHSR
jgi:ABC-type hemin transport system substrate-binding protein